jgi:hypothetical protein
MSIPQIYSNQYRWRKWTGIYADLGELSGRLILDLGCGIGDQARDLAGLGAAITEVDDFFGHEPLASRWVALAERYYGHSLEDGVYRFRSHDHVHDALSRHGWRIDVDRNVEDDEFCFSGPADSDLIGAWETRLAFMMPRFRERFGIEAAGFDSAFLQCLGSEAHRSKSRVWFILARPPDGRQNAGRG